MKLKPLVKVFFWVQLFVDVMGLQDLISTNWN
jgi:hypothetical protein